MFGKIQKEIVLHSNHQKLVLSIYKDTIYLVRWLSKDKSTYYYYFIL